MADLTAYDTPVVDSAFHAEQQPSLSPHFMPDRSSSTTYATPLFVLTAIRSARVCEYCQNEPTRDGDRSPRLPTDDADLDLAVAGEAVFEAVLGTCHPDLHLIHDFLLR